MHQIITFIMIYGWWELKFRFYLVNTGLQYMDGFFSFLLIFIIFCFYFLSHIFISYSLSLPSNSQLFLPFFLNYFLSSIFVWKIYFLFFSPSTTCSIIPILFQYMEKVPGGGSVFRSSRAESKQEQRHEVLQQEAVEKLYNKLQASFESCFPKQGSYSLPQLNSLYLRPQSLNISYMQHFIKII